MQNSIELLRVAESGLSDSWDRVFTLTRLEENLFLCDYIQEMTCDVVSDESNDRSDGNISNGNELYEFITDAWYSDHLSNALTTKHWIKLCKKTQEIDRPLSESLMFVLLDESVIDGPATAHDDSSKGGKIISERLLTPNDPLFSQGISFFSTRRPASKKPKQ